MSSYYNQSQCSLSQYIPTNKKFWLNYAILSEITNTDKSLYEQSFQFQNIYTDGVYNILSLIDRSKLILCCINRQNVKIKQLVICRYKSGLNYEKIKLIDLIKYLIINRRIIDKKLEYLERNQSCFAKEISANVLQLNESSNLCADIQINEEEITKEFNLSPCVVDKILNDCGSDLSEIEKIIFEKETELYKKLKSIKSAPHQRIDKPRFGRLCDRMLQYFQLDLSPNLFVVSNILERLCQGQCTSRLHRSHCVFSETESNGCEMEISLSQLQRIVAMKSVVLELEKKVHEHIIELTGLQVCFGNDNIPIVHSRAFGGHSISSIGSPVKTRPINIEKRKCFVTSTPAPGKSHKRIPLPVPFSFESVEMIPNTREDSLSSLDSGYFLTPGNERASLRGSCDNFDVIPFSDDEYEKIEDDENNQMGELDMHSESAIDSLGNSRDFIPIIQRAENAIEFCKTSNLCRISHFTRRLFRSVDDNSMFSVLHRSLDRQTWRCLTRSEVRCVLDLNFDLDPLMALSASEKQDLQQQIIGLIGSDKSRSHFDIILDMAVERCRQNESSGSIKENLHWLEQHWKSFRNHRGNRALLTGQCERGLDNQNNNSACSAHIVAPSSALLDQNTNNNADSRDEENSDYMSSPPEDGIDPDDLDTELRVAFEHILSDKTPTANRNRLVDISDMMTTSSSSCSGDGTSVGPADLYSEARFRQYRDVTVNTTSITEPNWHESGSIWTDEESLERVSSSDDSPGPIDELELVLKLSELHLGSELRAEQHNRSVLIADRNRVVANYCAVTASLGYEATLANQDESGHINNNEVCDRSGDQINIPPKSQFPSKENNQRSFNTAFVDVSLGDCAAPKRCRFSETDLSIGTVQETSSDNSTLNCIDRLALTIQLARKLLDMTGIHLKFISTMIHNNTCSMKSTVLRNRSLLVSCLHQRVDITAKILSNIKYVIQSPNQSIKHDQNLLEIDNLLEMCENLLESSTYTKGWIKRCGYEIDKMDGTNFQSDLPDNLLIKMDPSDYRAIVTTSSRRLQVTIEALSSYPCYDYLVRLYQLQFEQSATSFVFNHPRIGDCVHHLDLVQKLCKLRRVNAICAFNIVDLHVLLTKLESDSRPDYRETETDVKNLLAIWRTVDDESHRLLKCSSLVHHVMGVARQRYIDMVSVIAVMQSVLRTVELSDHESGGIKMNIDTLLSYKVRVVEWLDEIDLCASIISEKRMTNKRFRYYDDIHNYIEVNLKTISELVDKIKNECQRAVDMVFEVVSYCASLPDCSITFLGNALTSSVMINNHQLLDAPTSYEHINDTLFNAIIDLEELTLRISNTVNDERDTDSLCELTFQGAEILKDIRSENSSLFVSDTQAIANHRANVSEMASEKINEKILEIASKAATKALLLFVDKFDINVPQEESDRDHPIPCDDRDGVLTEISDEIVEEISRAFSNRAAVSELQSEVAVNDQWELKPSISGMQVNDEQPVVTEWPVSMADEDTISTQCEQLRSHLLGSCLEELQLIDNRSMCVSSCVLAIADRPSRDRHWNTVQVQVHSELVADLGTALQVLGGSVVSAESVRDHSGELTSLRAHPAQKVPVSSLKQHYDSHWPLNHSTRLFDSKPHVTGRYSRNRRILPSGSSNLPEIKTSLTTCYRPAPINRITRLVAQFSQPDQIDSGQHRDRSAAVVRLTYDQISVELLHSLSDQIVIESARHALTDHHHHPVVLPWVLQLADTPDTGTQDMDWPSESRLLKWPGEAVTHTSNLETVAVSSSAPVEEKTSAVSVHSATAADDDHDNYHDSLLPLVMTPDNKGEQISRSVLQELTRIDYLSPVTIIEAESGDWASPLDTHEQPISSCGAIVMTTTCTGDLSVDPVSECTETRSGPAAPHRDNECLHEVGVSMESIWHQAPSPIDERIAVSSILANSDDFCRFDSVAFGDVVLETCAEIVADKTESVKSMSPTNGELLLRQQPEWGEAVYKSSSCRSRRETKPQSTGARFARAWTVRGRPSPPDPIVQSAVDRNCSNRFSFSDTVPSRSLPSRTPKQPSVPVTMTVVMVVMVLILLVLLLCVCSSPLRHWCNCLRVPDSLFPRITARGLPF